MNGLTNFPNLTVGANCLPCVRRKKVNKWIRDRKREREKERRRKGKEGWLVAFNEISDGNRSLD